jgi:menaquinone-9 beta-reductase
MVDRADALIIGGGPAGLATAIVLARHGLKTVLCEHKHFPVDKPCGEGIMPVGLAHLEQLGVKQHLSAGEVYPFVGVRYRLPDGSGVAAPFAEGPGWGVRRTLLSSGLLRAAENLKTLDIREGTRAEVVARTAEGTVVQVGNSRVLARLLIGADGLRSGVRRWACLAGPAPSHRRWGARQHFAIAPWSPYVEVYWGRGIEAYITPCSPGQVGIAFLWDAIRYDQVQGGSALIPSLLQAFPELMARLAGVPACSVPRTIGPLQHNARAPADDGVILIGDAAGYLDPISGEGISLATAQALALEWTVVPVLRRDPGLSPRAKDLAAYTSAYRAIVAPYYRTTRLALFLSRHPALAARVVQALGRQPDVFQWLLSTNMGRASLRRLKPGQVGRFARDLLRSNPAPV